jgi:hypothetical protein
MIERISCLHCEKTGTCRNGVDGVSCATCSRKGSRYGDHSDAPKGLVCSVCEGRGSVEPFTLKLQNRFLPFFAMGFVVLLLAFIAIAYFSNNGKGFETILGFAGTLIGSITGYYFGGKQIDVSTESKTDTLASPPPRSQEPQTRA